jgi:aminoglycoside/choline kinase family phosphotransferase
MDHQKDILQLYEQYYGEQPEETYPLPPSASNRLYYRLVHGENSAIGAYNPDKAENDAFIYICQKLRDVDVKVPQVYLNNSEKKVYLIQDIGDIKLLDLVEEYRKNQDTDYLEWYRKVIDQMPAIQHKSTENFDFSICYPRHAFDRQSIQWDLNYFKYYFLKLAYIPFHEQKLEDDFQHLADFLLQAPDDFFLFRDFQSRNIMIHNNEVYFIDFQGGRKGALQYDLASLLYEAKVGLTAGERKLLLSYYLEVFSSFPFFKKEVFLRYFPAFVIIRILQAFGAYGYRGYFERKSFFLNSIPPALENLKWVLQEYDISDKFPYLAHVLNTMIGSFQSKIPVYDESKLTVTVNSFSYKKAFPEDFSGNGGGFVFDCRALPNPGRFEQFKTKTGQDNEVIEFLEKEAEVNQFLNSTKKLLAASIENYLHRSFEHLMVSFGCTGGQHRSVFCAENISNWILKKYDVNLQKNHYELGG